MPTAPGSHRAATTRAAAVSRRTVVPRSLLALTLAGLVAVGVTDVPQADAATAKPLSSLVKTLTRAQAVPADQPLYVVPNNPASVAAAQHPESAAALSQIAGQPTAIWLTENSNLANAGAYLADAAAKNQTPVFVLYAIPHRDCGSYSAGGFATAQQYVDFVNQIKSGLGSRRAAFIVEPDALAQLGICGMTAEQQAERVALIRFAATTLTSSTVQVYLDAGGAYSGSASSMASRLTAAGVEAATGFALNTSAYDTTANEIAYGTTLSGLIGGKHFVIDTSRNGVGTPAGTPDGAFCNVTGLALGTRPTLATGNSLIDAYLWVKYPGESDGDCGNGAPYSGVFWLDYALMLVADQP